LNKKMIAIMCVLILIGCKQSDDRIVRSGDLELRQLNDLSSADCVVLDRAVPLETTDLSILGTINKVKVSPAEADILVGDFRSQKKVLRFSDEGIFLNKYGEIGKGPGEFEYLIDFGILPDSSIVICSAYKLIHYNKDGRYLSEIDFDFRPRELVVVGSTIYVSIARKRGSGAGALAVYDQELSFRGYEGESDPKLDKFLYLHRQGIAARKGEIVMSQNFSMAIQRFVIEDGTWHRHHFPDRTQDHEALWKKDRLTQEDETLIRMSLHRPSLIFGLEQGFFFQERAGNEKIFRYNLFVPEENKLFQLRNEYNEWKKSSSPSNIWSYPVGSSGNQLIGLLDDEHILAELVERYPDLPGLEQGPEDNPILLFYDVKVFDGL